MGLHGLLKGSFTLFSVLLHYYTTYHPLKYLWPHFFLAEIIYVTSSFIVLVVMKAIAAALFIQENIYLVDRFHGPAFHGYWGAACREAHTNFPDEPKPYGR
jgi:hypothetical protein